MGSVLGAGNFLGQGLEEKPSGNSIPSNPGEEDPYCSVVQDPTMCTQQSITGVMHFWTEESYFSLFKYVMLLILFFVLCFIFTDLYIISLCKHPIAYLVALRGEGRGMEDNGGTGGAGIARKRAAQGVESQCHQRHEAL